MVSAFPHISLFVGTQISQLPACCVLYVILVACWKNRQFYYGVTGWYEVFQQRDFGFVDEIVTCKYYQRPRILRTVSECVGTSGQQVSTADLKVCFEHLIAQIFACVAVERLSDEDLFEYCHSFTFCTPSNGNDTLPEQARGGHYFANLLFSLGMGAALSLCQKPEQQPEPEQKEPEQKEPEPERPPTPVDGIWVFDHPNRVYDFEYTGGEEYDAMSQRIAQ